MSQENFTLLFQEFTTAAAPWPAEWMAAPLKCNNSEFILSPQCSSVDIWVPPKSTNPPKAVCSRGGHRNCARVCGNGEKLCVLVREVVRRGCIVRIWVLWIPSMWFLTCLALVLQKYLWEQILSGSSPSCGKCVGSCSRHRTGLVQCLSNSWALQKPHFPLAFPGSRQEMGQEASKINKEGVCDDGGEPLVS